MPIHRHPTLNYCMFNGTPIINVQFDVCSAISYKYLKQIMFHLFYQYTIHIHSHSSHSLWHAYHYYYYYCILGIMLLILFIFFLFDANKLNICYRNKKKNTKKIKLKLNACLCMCVLLKTSHHGVKRQHSKKLLRLIVSEFVVVHSTYEALKRHCTESETERRHKQQWRE